MQSKRNHFTHKNIRLYYKEAGKGSPLLFLPGALRVTAYAKNIEYLSAFYRVIALDLPGFGKSTTPNTVWGLEEYADFINVFIDHLHLRSVAVVGHSYGGGVGLYLAMQHKHIAKLMLFSPMGMRTKHTRLMFYWNVLVTKSLNDYFAMKSNHQRAIVFPKAISTVTQNLSGVKKILQITNKELYSQIPPQQLAKITVPVKLLWARHDELFPPENGTYFHDHIHQSTLEIIDGNHDWITTHPEESTEKIREFIK